MSDQERHFDYVFKVILIGDSGVGKSATALRYTDNVFVQTVSSVGIDLKVKYTEIEGRVVKIQVWDTAGQERFRSITSLSLRKSNGILIVYDITNEQSFESVSYWMNTIKTSCLPEDVKVVMVGNKCDLENRRVVDKAKGESFAKEYDVPFFETSTKADININEAFDTLVRLIMADEKCVMKEDLIKPPLPSSDEPNCCVKS